MRHTLSARPRTLPGPARVHVFTRSRPGAWCQLCLNAHGGTHCPPPLQDVLWELPQDPNGRPYPWDW